MKPRTTLIWFVLAAMLFAFIWFYQRHLQSSAPVVLKLVSGFRPADVTAVDIYPARSEEISVIRTNGAWQLEKPFTYPAQVAAIQALLGTIAQLTPVMRLSAAEMSSHKNAGAEFGFDNPQFSVVITAGDQQWQLRVGNKTAPGDGVYVRVVGLDGAFVTDTDWLQLLPQGPNDWRDTSLVNATAQFDWVVITNGAKNIELRQDPTNRLWRLTRPLQARADNVLMLSALQQLRSAHITQFITDDPKTDLAAYDLQPAELDVLLGNGTNLATIIHVGKSLTNDPTQVYAQLEGWNSVVAIPKDTLAGWSGAVNSFRDPRLVDLTVPVGQIEVQGVDHFLLERQGANTWTIPGQTFPVDSAKVVDFIRQLANLRVAAFVKDVVTAKDLQDYGLAAPARMEQITLRAADTNNVIAQLLFGATDTNGAPRVYVKRADEGFVYAIDQPNLPQAAWEFRDRRIWNFSETNVAQVTLNENKQTRTLLRTGINAWSLAPGSQGIISPAALEEAVHQLGILATPGWVDHNAAPEKIGLNTNNLSITIELKTGEKLSLAFGTELPQFQTALAAVTLDGDRWAFVFPPTVYQLVVEYLTIPPVSASPPTPAP
jgi:hypothetical protein